MAKAMGGVFQGAVMHSQAMTDNQAMMDNCHESASRVAECEKNLMQQSCYESLYGESPYRRNYAQQACFWNTMWLSDVQQTLNKLHQQKVEEKELQLTNRAFEKFTIQQLGYEEDDVFYGGCSPDDYFSSRKEFTNGGHSFSSFDRAPGESSRSPDGNVSRDSCLSEKQCTPHHVNLNRTPSNCKPGLWNRELERQSSTSSYEPLLHKRRAMQERINQTPASISSGCIEGSPSVARMLTFDDNSPKQRLLKLNHSYNMATATEALPEAAEQNRHLAEFSVPMCTWAGTLPTGFCNNPVYSCKVFLGGVPWDITADDLQAAFSVFGSIKVEFPNSSHGSNQSRHQSHTKQCRQDSAQCFGYVYVIFEDDQHVKSMLQACSKGEYVNNDECYYFKVSSRKMPNKEVQVIPWLLGNSNYVAELGYSQTLNSETTIFVGALHGMLNAEGLALVMNELFGNVSYAGIDTDKHKYPIGSGRVTFTDSTSYMKAVNAAFVEIKTPKFVKKVQIDPYLEETLCKRCRENAGPYFCRNLECFTYFCHPCWNLHHNQIDPSTGVHKPLCRNLKNVFKTNINTLMVMDPRRVKPQ